MFISSSSFSPFWECSQLLEESKSSFCLVSSSVLSSPMQSSPSSVWKVLHAKSHRPGIRLPVVFAELLPLATLVILTICWAVSSSDLLEEYPRLFIITIGYTFAYLVVCSFSSHSFHFLLLIFSSLFIVASDRSKDLQRTARILLSHPHLPLRGCFEFVDEMVLLQEWRPQLHSVLDSRTHLPLYLFQLHHDSLPNPLCFSHHSVDKSS
jgi:hypothetical protein